MKLKITFPLWHHVRSGRNIWTITFYSVCIFLFLHVAEGYLLLCPVGGATRQSEAGDRSSTWATFPQGRHPEWCSNYRKISRHFSCRSGASFFNCMISLPGPYFENLLTLLLGWQCCHPLTPEHCGSSRRNWNWIELFFPVTKELNGMLLCDMQILFFCF